jgi:hypothetical protein
MGLKFGTLWFGNKHTILQEVSWNSYIHHGHELNIYLYDMSIEVPEGAIKRDANEIIPEDGIFLPTFESKSFGEGHSQFSDIFRIYMLKKTDLIWTDSDVVCLTDSWPDPKPYLFGYMIDNPLPYEGPIRVNGDILYIDNDDIINQMIKGFSDLPDNFVQDQTLIGPDLLTKVVSENNLYGFVKEESMFHPIRYGNADYFSRPDKYKETMDFISNSVTVALYHSYWHRHKVFIPGIQNEPDESTVIGYFTKKYIPKYSGLKTN